MTTQWKTVMGDVKPLEIDTVTSSYVVYEHRNIQEVQVHDNPSDPTSPTHTQWQYEERETPVAEYNELHSPATQKIMQRLNDLELQVAQLQS